MSNFAKYGLIHHDQLQISGKQKHIKNILNFTNFQNHFSQRHWTTLDGYIVCSKWHTCQRSWLFEYPNIIDNSLLLCLRWHIKHIFMNVIEPLKVSQSITLQLHLVHVLVIELLPLFYELVVMTATTLKPYEMENFINAFNLFHEFLNIFIPKGSNVFLKQL